MFLARFLLVNGSLGFQIKATKPLVGQPPIKGDYYKVKPHQKGPVQKERIVFQENHFSGAFAVKIWGVRGTTLVRGLTKHGY